MTTATATLHPAARTVPPAHPPVMTVGEVLARVSALAAELAPGHEAWDVAGPHVTAVVAAARHALGGSGSPITVDDEVPPILRLRDLACTAQRAAGAPATVLAAEDVTPHLAALLETVTFRGARPCH